MSYTWSWIVVGIYCIAMLYIGYLGYRKTKNITDYYVTSRNLGLGITITLFTSAFISAVSMVSYTGFAYGYGWCLLLKYGCGCALGWILLQIFSKKLYNVNYVWYTTSDLFCSRYYDEKFMRGFQGLFNAFGMLVYVVIGLMGVGTILEVFLGISYFWAVLIVAIVFVTYTTIGGMYSIAWANAVQCIALAIGLLVASFFAVRISGGIANINSVIANVQGGITKLLPGAMHSINAKGAAPLGKSIGMIIGIGTMCPVAIYYHRIFFSVKSKKVAGSFIGISAIILAVLYTAIALIGLSGRVLLPELANVEQVFPLIVRKLPIVVSAIVIVAILSAIQSTLDAQLLSTTSSIINDVYYKLYKKNAAEGNILKTSMWATLVIGIIATAIALARFTLVINMYNFIMILIPTTLFPSLLLGLFWRRTTREAAIFGCIFGCVGGLLWIMYGPSNIPATLTILPIGIVLMVIISKFTPEPPKEVIEKFFTSK